MTQVCNGLLLRSLATLRAALIELPCRLQGSVTFLARAYAMCMLVLAFNYLFAQLLMEYAQTVNEFKARETIKRANRIFVNVQENVPLHVALLTGAMFVTTGSGHESVLGVSIIIYTMARTFWLICYAGALDPVTATPLLSLLFGTPAHQWRGPRPIIRHAQRPVSLRPHASRRTASPDLLCGCGCSQASRTLPCSCR